MINHKDIKMGKNCLIDPTVQFYGDPEKISIGDNTRIDAFCIISGNVTLGSFIHVAAGCYLFGAAGIIMEDYSGISSRVSLYSATDDYVEGYLTNPTVDDTFKKITKGPIVLRKHALVGAGTVILPDVELGFGASVGAMSLVKNSLKECEIAVGIPAKVIKLRNREMLMKYESLHKGTIK